MQLCPVVVCQGRLGIELDGFAVVTQGFRLPAHAEVSRAPVVVGRAIFWIEGNGLVVLGDRFKVPARVAEDSSPVVAEVGQQPARISQVNPPGGCQRLGPGRGGVSALALPVSVGDLEEFLQDKGLAHYPGG